jgi:hypothetical protein
MEFGYIMKTLTVQLLKENLEALKLELAEKPHDTTSNKGID